jgi:hypothetical protein
MHRATHGVHRQDEMRPNPVSLGGFTGIYVPFDQIVTSSTRLPNVVVRGRFAAPFCVMGPAADDMQMHRNAQSTSVTASEAAARKA